MDAKQPKSPRAIVGVVESPPPRLTVNEAEMITKKQSKPDLAIKSMVDGTAISERISLLVASKLGEPLKKAGVTELKIARVFNDALGANTVSMVGKGEDAELVTMPDHRTRLAAAGMLVRICGYEKPTKIELDHNHTHIGVMGHFHGKELRELEQMETKLTVIAIDSESDPGIQPMVIGNGNGTRT